jgi:hypothetical protein
MDTEVIREAVLKRPFEPFTVRIVDGREYYITHPEWVAVSRRYVVVVDPQTEVPTWFEPLLIVSLHPGKPGNKKSGGNP